jgi:UDP-GlcNAc:undecaprenyl-phosphate/decaprenyl-phosphate GlcNAc-1-phosphate transferase
VVRRANYRGRHVIFPLGLLLLAAAGIGLAFEPTRWLVFLCGVGCLGLIDDLVDAQPRGWRGHVAAVRRGELSTGALKAAGTLGLAAWAAAGNGATGLALVSEALVLALAAHLGNLLDTRPGRAEKGLALTAGALCVAAWSLAPLVPIAPLLAPVAACSWLTLREHAMLGDTGASMIGGMIGIVLLSALAAPWTYPVLAALSVLAIYGEFRSIGSAVERVPLFQRLDSLGRAS